VLRTMNARRKKPIRRWAKVSTAIKKSFRLFTQQKECVNRELKFLN